MTPIFSLSIEETGTMMWGVLSVRISFYTPIILEDGKKKEVKWRKFGKAQDPRETKLYDKFSINDVRCTFYVTTYIIFFCGGSPKFDWRKRGSHLQISKRMLSKIHFSPIYPLFVSNFSINEYSDKMLAEWWSVRGSEAKKSVFLLEIPSPVPSYLTLFLSYSLSQTPSSPQIYSKLHVHILPLFFSTLIRFFLHFWRPYQP